MEKKNTPKHTTDTKPRTHADGIPVYCAYDEIVPIGSLKPNPRNPNRHPQDQLEKLGKIIRGNGWRNPITVSTRSGLIVKGHGRLLTAELEELKEVPVEYQNYESEEAELADLTADNRIAELAEIDSKMLADLFADIDTGAIDFELSGYTEGEYSELASALSEAVHDEFEENPSLAERFIFPPMTVLNAREGVWTNRKDEWMRVGIQSDLGRDKGLTYTSVSATDPGFYKAKKEKEKELGRTLSTKEFEENYFESTRKTDNSTSIFDPVLCELCVKWFSGEGSKVLDPFSGGSVRGIVSAITGREYTGIDLRAEQIEANVAQWDKIKKNYPTATDPCWITGDSLKTIPQLKGKYDMIMSCPPYADLEVYSDDPADLSTMKYDDFLAAYREIIRHAVDKLEENRFAVFVVGEVRGKDGNYISFVPDTIRAFEDAGAHFYNEAILVTHISAVAVRVSNPFVKSRKLGKVHQNVLVFVKGDAKKATEHCGDISADLPTDFNE